MTETPALWVVMPVYNEAAAIAEVINEWVTVLRTTASSFVFLVINDGSTDGTQTILENLPCPELLLVHRPNSGHGSSCLFGYRKAVEQGATWIFQIDSDGQCDPRFFEAFWRWRLKAPSIFGCRVHRDDGCLRWVISRMVSVVVFLHAGKWIKDANVPYRLMRGDRLEEALRRLPENAFFSNILLSCLLAEEIHWLPIRFRKRKDGQSTVRLPALARYTRLLGRELCWLRAYENKR